MSPRRKQSTKDLGAILSEAVPVVVAEEVQLPADSPLPHPAQPDVEAEAAPAEQPAPEAEAEATPAEAEAAGAEATPADAEAEADGASGGEVPPLPATVPDETVLSPEVEVAAAEAAADEAGGPWSRPAAHEPGAEAALWRKSTIPFRADQYAEIGHVLADFYLRTDVQLTVAEVVRLGLDKMIEALKEPELREAALLELYRQQRRESLGNEKLKHSKSRGLGDYLAAHGRLPGA